MIDHESHVTMPLYDTNLFIYEGAFAPGRNLPIRAFLDDLVGRFDTFVNARKDDGTYPFVQHFVAPLARKIFEARETVVPDEIQIIERCLAMMHEHRIILTSTGCRKNCCMETTIAPPPGNKR